MKIHVVQAGESVWSIASDYGVDPDRLAADNEVPPSGALAVGQTLVVRFPRQVHVVRSGETLTSIAAAYGTSVRTLWRKNWPLNKSIRDRFWSFRTAPSRWAQQCPMDMPIRILTADSCMPNCRT